MNSEKPFSEWIGRSETSMDFVDESRVSKMYATLNMPCPKPIHGQELPSLWHWMFFAPAVPFAELGYDGHPERGGFLPPVDLPRRMWAGGRLDFYRHIKVGEEIRRVSSIKDIVSKKGRTGEMVFVTVAHQILDDHGVLINEEHDIVYRDLMPEGVSVPSYQTAEMSSDFSLEIFPNPVTLFRYSALTFNGHRIHYDRKYCNEEEGYPGLVFHGPLTATHLAQLLLSQSNDIKLTGFRFRAIKPLFDNHAFVMHGREETPGVYNLWATDYLGHTAMEAQATCER
ncbi:MAG: MaoC family dehydratase N-terminal domain-containing protein [Burkholderiales bacterium]|nr:MaoC family dehydratase N-terminal domain-containing protein [Burkholderiales bacterium]OUT79291.1 MAG: hypothetical protein CBB82_01675 [Betaproteobacteria bacterium TMED22]|tara:strand:- start:8867 stop:9718 length:852 start_codon:yes stop_codon:yes gene_type:complete